MKTHLTLAFALLLLCTGAALAQTPDGETPAEETVCDNETGAAYGLCNAYCEAMDCETDEPNASATACSRVQDKFQQITGRDLPCEVPPVICPCADPAVSSYFAAVLAGEAAIETCYTPPGFAGGFEVRSSGLPVVYAITIPGGFASYCGPHNATGGGLPISLEQRQVCAELLEQAANAQNVTCVP